MSDPLREVLDDYAIPYMETPRGWIQFDCPWCNPNTGKFYLGYHPDSAVLNCWKCGQVNLLKTLVELLPRSKFDELRKIAIACRQGREQGVAVSLVRSGHFKPPTGLGPLNSRHRDYLQGRGFDPESLERLWSIQGIGVLGNPPHRIYIPVTVQGREVSWTTRALSNKGIRYLSASNEDSTHPIKHLLYGEDYCRQGVIIVEGPTDVWRIGPGAVATFGTIVSPAQVSRLARFPIRMVCFDPAAELQADILAEQLAAFPGTTGIVHPDSGHDPGEFSEEEVAMIRHQVLGDDWSE